MPSPIHTPSDATAKIGVNLADLPQVALFCKVLRNKENIRLAKLRELDYQSVAACQVDRQTGVNEKHRLPGQFRQARDRQEKPESA